MVQKNKKTAITYWYGLFRKGKSTEAGILSKDQQGDSSDDSKPSPFPAADGESSGVNVDKRIKNKMNQHAADR